MQKMRHCMGYFLPARYSGQKQNALTHSNLSFPLLSSYEFGLALFQVGHVNCFPRSIAVAGTSFVLEEIFLGVAIVKLSIAGYVFSTVLLKYPLSIFCVSRFVSSPRQSSSSYLTSLAYAAI